MDTEYFECRYRVKEKTNWDTTENPVRAVNTRAFASYRA